MTDRYSREMVAALRSLALDGKPRQANALAMDDSKPARFAVRRLLGVLAQRGDVKLWTEPGRDALGRERSVQWVQITDRGRATLALDRLREVPAPEPRPVERPDGQAARNAARVRLMRALVDAARAGVAHDDALAVIRNAYDAVLGTSNVS